MVENWADKEIELACKKENPNWDGKSWDYGCACYKNAGEAYKAALKELKKEGHSGFSWGVTISILKRLLDGKPLTPITDDDFVNSKYQCRGEKYVTYENFRYHALFKYVYEDGKVEYHDIDRAVGFDIHRPKSYWGGGRASSIIDELFPITMPYFPPDKPYKVATEEHLYDKALGDYDMYAILYVITPDGKRIPVQRYYKQEFDHWYKYSDWEPIKGALAAPTEWIEISKEEWKALKKMPQIETTYNGKDPVKVIETGIEKCCEVGE